MNLTMMMSSLRETEELRFALDELYFQTDMLRFNKTQSTNAHRSQRLLYRFAGGEGSAAKTLRSNIDMKCAVRGATFLAKGDALISFKAFAPRSRASGSKRGPLLSDSQYAAVPPAANDEASSPAPVQALFSKCLAIPGVYTVFMPRKL